MLAFLREYVEFLKTRKKLILIPFWLIIFILGAILLVGQSTPVVAPFIYTLF